MFSSELYQKTLIEPAKNSSELLIVSGYATAAMSFHHMSDLINSGNEISIRLIVGMTKRDGIDIANHNTFVKLMEDEFSDMFKCSYVHIDKPVHSKLYLWRSKDNRDNAFMGSANYTQTAFNERHYEILTQCDTKKALEYFEKIEANTIFCNSHDIENHISIFKPQRDSQLQGSMKLVQKIDPEGGVQNGLKSITVPLTTKKGEVQNSAGLNWGHRTKEGYNRNLNEAYIQLRPEVYNSDFFPTRGKHFTVQTDDNKHFVCTRAQKNEAGSAIETPHNNSLLGEYFRRRLDLANGEFVTREHLDKYGRLDVDFFKVDEETYIMDFSKPE